MHRNHELARSAIFALSVLAYVSFAQASAPMARAADSAALSALPDTRTAFDFAYEACLDKQEGSACSVAFDEQKIDGTCVLALDARLICLPDEPSNYTRAARHPSAHIEHSENGDPHDSESRRLGGCPRAKFLSENRRNSQCVQGSSRTREGPKRGAHRETNRWL